MKKLTIVIAIIIFILCLNKEEKYIVPKEIIRFRVIANSNEEKDQQTKKAIVKSIGEDIKELKLTPKNINSSREEIKKALPKFQETIEKTLENEKVEQDYTINYGNNYFPEKEYENIKYEAGEYESLVITLGNGLGENFWCILFPPLCLLDSEETETENIEYTSFIKEMIKKYF